MDFSAFTQVFDTFKNKGKDFVNTLQSLPQQFQAGYELAKPTIRRATIPVAQIAEGIGQRANYSQLASPVSPIERSFLKAQQYWIEKGALEPGSDYHIDRPFTPQETMAERFQQNTYPGWEKTSSAFPKYLGYPVSTTSALEQARNQALNNFTPLAKFQLQGVPVGVQPPLWGRGGTAFGGHKGTDFRKSITVSEELPPKGISHVTAHELLHAAVRGKGGIPWDNFVRDFISYSIQNPEVTQHFSWLDEGHRTGPEELFAEMGAWFGPNIFNTPLGKYYTGILNESPPPRKNIEGILQKPNRGGIR